jgi:hypothetical protein
MLPAWRYYKDLYIDHTKIDSDLTDFPVLVKLNSTNFDFSKAQSTGYDIRFTLQDGTLLKYERERHDSTNQLAEYWVKIPSVLSTVDTTFRMYFGNPSAVDGADPTNVWDSNFAMVQHMNDNPDTSHIKDSTINANDGTKYAAGQPTETDGIIGTAQSFDGSDDYVECDDDSSLRVQNMTLESLVHLNQPLGNTNYPSIISKDNFTAKTGYFLGQYQQSSNSLGIRIMDGTTNYDISYSESNYNEWAYFIGVYDGQYLRVYKNGVEQVNSNIGSITIAHDTTALNIGSNSLNSFIDETRISNIARSPAYIKANDYNLRLNTLLTIGDEQSNITGDIVWFGANF